MALSALDDPQRTPDRTALATTLGRCVGLWDALEHRLQDEVGPLEPQWNFAGPKYGWSLRLKQGKRIVIYMIPGVGEYLAGIILGERAVEAARWSKLPRNVIEMIDAAKPYAEGRGIRLRVRNKKDLVPVEKLVSIKMSR